MLRKAGAKPKVRPDIKLDAAALKIYEGSYKSGDFDFSFKVKDGKLFGGPPRQELEMSPVEKVTFEAKGVSGALLVFKIEGSKSTAMTLKQGDREIVLKKIE